MIADTTAIKNVMENQVNLYVFVCMPNGEVTRAGRLLSRNLNMPGAYEGFFAYDPGYLTHPLAFPLDPVHLPLSAKTFRAARPEAGIHWIFEDSLPDTWGRHVLIKKYGLYKGHIAPAHLLSVLKNTGLGALMYSRRKNPPLKPKDTSIHVRYLKTILSETEELEGRLGELEVLRLRYLLSCGTSAGGARPKAILKDGESYWLAKFPSKADPTPYTYVHLEWLGLALGKAIGLNIPLFQVKELAGRSALLIRRFDISDHGGRYAIVSFKTLLGMESYPEGLGYRDLAEVLRRISAKPKIDLERLYRQMILNICISNGDDHLQNFAILHREEGWRLSPSYDLVPNIWRQEQLLWVNGKRSEITSQDILAEGRAFGFSKKRSLAILKDVMEQLYHARGLIDQTQELLEDRGARHTIFDRIKGRINELSKGLG